MANGIIYVLKSKLYEKMARYGLEHAGRPAGAKRP
jgi:hypothetical protein